MKLTVPALLATAVLMCGCSTIAPVNPWEKGNLAKPLMTFDDNPLEGRFAEHVYSSKENSNGGGSVGGGGCGCN